MLFTTVRGSNLYISFLTGQMGKVMEFLCCYKKYLLEMQRKAIIYYWAFEPEKEQAKSHGNTFTHNGPCHNSKIGPAVASIQNTLLWGHINIYSTVIFSFYPFIVNQIWLQSVCYHVYLKPLFHFIGLNIFVIKTKLLIFIRHFSKFT